VKKNREITDQRNILVHLTEKGKKKFRTACPAVKKLDNESTKDFSPAEIATLMDFLNRLKESSYRTRRLDQLVRVESRI
jgi:DNA-binding MarR family transcriptional regulator